MSAGWISLVWLALASAATVAVAQPATYPAKSVRIVVPAAVNTPIDYTVRIIARELGGAWNEGVLVDNRAAGHGVVAQEMVANAQPDGHTLLMQTTAFATLPLFYKLPYDSERDFFPVSRLASTALVLVTHPSLAVGSTKDLIALARRKPAAVSYASYGSGSITHLAGEAFGILASIRLSHAAQRDVLAAMSDVLAGGVPTMFAEIVYAQPHVEAGALRALATTARTRSPLMPALPTLAESGVDGYELTFWFGAFVRTGTSAAAIDRLASELSRILDAPGMESRMHAQGFEKAWLPAADFQRFVRGESKRFAALLRKAGDKMPRLN